MQPEEAQNRATAQVRVVRQIIESLNTLPADMRRSTLVAVLSIWDRANEDDS